MKFLSLLIMSLFLTVVSCAHKKDCGGKDHCDKQAKEKCNDGHCEKKKEDSKDEHCKKEKMDCNDGHCDKKPAEPKVEEKKPEAKKKP